MKAYTPIKCSHHDFIEIACLHHYELNIELTSGEWVRGIAHTTHTNAIREEHLELQKANEKFSIRLDLIRSITPLNKNAMFGKQLFNDLSSDAF